MGTIVLRGMAAEFCSESTERDADESSYGLVFTSDVMTGAIAGGKGSIQPPGDIDVWVIDEDRGRIYVLECKNLAFARTPFELAAELRALTETTPQHRSIIKKHQRRVDWLKENLQAVLAWAKLAPTKQWEVHSAVVVDEHAMSPKLQDVGESVFALDELQEDQADFGLRALCTATYTPYPTDRADTDE
jgi:hypothetical protein